jgi:S1-C subfamily serine protease
MTCVLATGLIALAVSLGHVGLASAEESTGKAVHAQVVPSTVWVRISSKNWGAGTLVDKQRRWILTSYHVVVSTNQVMIHFPLYEQGRLIVDQSHYEQHGKPVKGRVIHKELLRDLALIEVEAVPPEVVEIRLAKAGALPGDRVHGIGHAKVNGGLFAYHAGTVRQVCQRVDSYSGVRINCRVLETQSPHNPGDSGGPTVNDQGELVAITAAYVIPAQLISFHIDLSEITAFLDKARGGTRKA